MLSSLCDNLGVRKGWDFQYFINRSSNSWEPLCHGSTRYHVFPHSAAHFSSLRQKVLLAKPHLRGGGGISE